MTSLRADLVHARSMAEAEHRPTCSGKRHDRYGIDLVHPDPDCSGCMTDRERSQWADQADEIAQYLEQHSEDDQHLI